jgi:hypothetical protein
VTAHLEYLAVTILWVAAQRPGRFEDYEDHMTLGNALKKIKVQGLLAPAIIDTVHAVNRLRNSVAHRGAVSGVTVPGTAQRGVYKGGHVFTDLQALEQLVTDARAATTAMVAWLQSQGVFMNDSPRDRSPYPTKVVLLIGTRHDYQWPGRPGSEQFRTQVEADCRKHGVTLLAEEMSRDALHKAGVHSSVCQEVADSLGIAHQYSDPSIEEQKQLGIANPGKSYPSAFSPVRDPRDIDPEIAAANEIREQCWFQRIIEAESWPVLFVCGAHHVESFRALLEANGIVSHILYPIWMLN